MLDIWPGHKEVVVDEDPELDDALALLATAR
jgi:hypothetical protein